MENYLGVGLLVLVTAYNVCYCYNNSTLPFADTAVSVNESNIPFVHSGAAIEEPKITLASTGLTVNDSSPRLNMSDIPLNESRVAIAELPKTLKSTWISVNLSHPHLESTTDFAVNVSDMPLEDHTQARETSLLQQCSNCLPTLKNGSNLYFWMAQSNNLVCGKSVCNNSLDETRCESGLCEKCHCDVECTHYGDCCPDMFLTRDPQTPAAEFSCFSQQFIESTVIWSKSYKMASGCVDVTDKADTEACLNPDPMLLEDNRPVYSHWTQLHYRNLHCARCNGITDVVSWDVKPFCENYVDFSTVRSQEELLQKLRDEKDCAVHYIPPVASPLRECSTRGDIVRTCNVTGSWLPDEFQSDIERACSLYSQPITLKFTNYKNVFCAQCNGELLWVSDSCSNPIVEPNVLPFSMLLDVRSAATEDPSREHELTCAEDHLYDPYIDDCRLFLCPHGKFPENHQCTSVFKSANGLGYIIHFTLTPKEREFVFVRSGYKLLYHVMDFSMSSFTLFRPKIHTLNMNLTYVSHKGSKFAEVYTIDVQFAIVASTDVPIIEAERSLSAMLSTPFWWYESLSLNPIYFDITWQENISSDRLSQIFSARNLDSEPHEELSWTTYHTTGRFGDIPALFLSDSSAYIQINGLLGCKIIELNATEFIVNDSKTITVKQSGSILKEGDFLWKGDKVHICTEFTGQRTVSESLKNITFDKTEVILTVVCSSLSMCGLAITLIIYLILPSLRTIPARNNIFLFINLFLAQLLFLTGSAAKVSQPVCRTLAIIIHYFWMSTFCWKVVCAFHMYRLFTNPLKALRYTGLLLKYILFAQLTPCVIIGLVIGVNLAVSERKRYGYAERPNLCFLSSTLDVALGFVTPVCLAICLNVFFFTRVVYVLRNRPKIQRHTSQSDVKESVLYFKMSLILGFTWVLGFLALIVNDKSLWYVFTVVNASIGVFVFVGFGLKNLSLNSLIHGFGNKDHLTNSTSKTYETGDTSPKSDTGRKNSPKNIC